MTGSPEMYMAGTHGNFPMINLSHFARGPHYYSTLEEFLWKFTQTMLFHCHWLFDIHMPVAQRTLGFTLSEALDT